MIRERQKKNNVNIGDYNYRHDVAQRLLIATLSEFELDVLREILNLSLRFPISQLANSMDVDLATLAPVIERFANSPLLKQTGDSIVVDKDQRKSFELQIEKFDDDKVPGYDSLFASLRQVPIHILPDWYALPVGTDDILGSIAEDYLSTPKLYQRHLAEVTLSDPLAQAMLRDVFQSPDLKVRGADLRQKHGISHEKFQELMLELEFQLLCCVSYGQYGGKWEEQVTPFREWREYALHCRHVRFTSIEKFELIRSHRDPEFSFVKDISALLRAVEQVPLPIEDGGIMYSAAASWLPELRKDFYRGAASYLKDLLDRVLVLELAEIRDGALHATDGVAGWHRMSLQAQAMTLFRIPTKDLADYESILDDRTLREIERELRPAIGRGWIDLQAFINSLKVPLGSTGPVVLKQTGRRWRYEIPNYSELEREVLRWVIWHRMFETGMVMTGLYQGAPCFCVSPFGQATLG